jgi:hypothetical protein
MPYITHCNTPSVLKFSSCTAVPDTARRTVNGNSSATARTVIIIISGNFGCYNVSADNIIV